MTRVLVVDDAKFMRVKIREILEEANYIIAGEAADGEQAADLYKKTAPGPCDNGYYNAGEKRHKSAS